MDEDNPFLDQQLPEGKKAEIYSIVTQPDDNLRGITLEWLQENAIYTEIRFKKFKTDRKKSRNFYLVNKYAIYGPYTYRDFSTEPLDKIVSLADEFRYIKPHIAALSIQENQKTSEYIVFNNPYYYTENTDVGIHGDFKGDYKIIKASSLLPLDQWLIQYDNKKLSKVSRRIMYELLILFMNGIGGVSLKNILINIDTLDVEFLFSPELLPSNYLESNADEKNVYFYMNTSRSDAKSLLLWKMLVTSHIESLVEFVNKYRKKDKSFNTVRNITKDLLNSILEGQEEDEDEFYENFTNNVPVTYYYKPSSETKSKIVDVKPTSEFRSDIGYVSKRGIRGKTSVDDNIKKKNASKVIDNEYVVTLYNESIFDEESSEEESEVENIPTRIKMKKIDILDQANESIMFNRSQAIVSSNIGGMSNIPLKPKSKQYPTFSYRPKDDYALFNTVNVRTALTYYILTGDIENVQYATIELWRMHEIGNRFGPNSLFNELQIVCIDYIGPANPNLVICAIENTDRWISLLKKTKDEKLSTFNSIVSINDVMGLVIMLTESKKTDIVFKIGSVYQKGKIVTKPKKLLRIYNNAEDNILDEILEKYFIINEKGGSDDRDIIRFGILFYYLCMNENMEALSTLYHYMNFVNDKDNPRKLVKRAGNITNPMFIISSMLSDLVGYNISRFYKASKHNNYIFYYITLMVVKGIPFGSLGPITTYKVPDEYLRGNYKFNISGTSGKLHINNEDKSWRKLYPKSSTM